MLQAIFHAWERKLASITTDRVVRPFEWGLEWIPRAGSAVEEPADAIGGWVSRVMADTDAFYAPPATNKYTLSAASPDGDRLNAHTPLWQFPAGAFAPRPFFCG